jgi:2-isopropylmalate synthase
MTERITILDTTLRDGAQREGISLSANDKIRIAQRLDDLGVAYIEGGWPGSNPKDVEFFARARHLRLQHARIAAFCSTRHPSAKVEEDRNLQAVLEAGVRTAVMVGKSSAMHVEQVLGITREENLAMIRESVQLLVDRGLEVLFDAEHYFDGHKLDRAYALETLAAAADAGATCVVLCDTNGGSLPSEVARIVGEVRQYLPRTSVGMHAHNDNGMADANTLVAVEAGANHIQGTMNGYGERCGNADLCTVIPNLELKMGRRALANGSLARLTETARFVSEVANLSPNPHAPYVGSSAFTHKAGLHVSALQRVSDSYQHVDPALVGNEMRVLISELSGRANVAHKLREMGLEHEMNADQVRALAQRLKEMESQGYQFEGADGSFELMVRRMLPGYAPPFEVLDALVLAEKRNGSPMLSEATVKMRVGDQLMHTASDGDGPVNALDRAMRKALLPTHPWLEDVQLTDYKVRIVDPQSATAALTRVLIDASDGNETWTTVGCSVNIIEASTTALVDSLELALLGRSSGQRR